MRTRGLPLLACVSLLLISCFKAPEPTTTTIHRLLTSVPTYRAASTQTAEALALSHTPESPEALACIEAGPFLEQWGVAGVGADTSASPEDPSSPWGKRMAIIRDWNAFMEEDAAEGFTTQEYLAKTVEFEARIDEVNKIAYSITAHPLFRETRAKFIESNDNLLLAIDSYQAYARTGNDTYLISGNAYMATSNRLYDESNQSYNDTVQHCVGELAR